MPSDCLSFTETSFLSLLLKDYVTQKKELQPFYNRYPEIESFQAQIAEKSNSYSRSSRAILVDEIRRQYTGLQKTEAVEEQLQKLLECNAFTVTTGHQLNLGTGPLYFLYKISAAINMSQKLNERYPDQHFVPVYWMATEDHDFEEINFFHLGGQKIQWNRPFGGAVGRMDLSGMEEVLIGLKHLLGPGKHNTALLQIIEEAYTDSPNLASATRHLVHTLFGEYGLVVLDADSAALKTLFVPAMRQELEQKSSYEAVTATNEALKQVHSEYKIQVNPRECNLFYLTDQKRERLVQDNGGFALADGSQYFKKDALLQELEEHPERFSPNVMLRPLYQEVILPNLCYIGGGGELAYWLQLRASFESFHVPFPMLQLRSTVLLWSAKQAANWEKLGLSRADLFKKREELVNFFVRRESALPLDFSDQKNLLVEQFKALHLLADQTDASFRGAVAAQERKQIKGLEHLEKRMLKAQKKKHKDQIERLTELHESLFPNGSLQERFDNITSHYHTSSGQLIDRLVKRVNPLECQVLLLTLDTD
jgi:bacillithiol biosynthesis cysteine-adding enzyme BshC